MSKKSKRKLIPEHMELPMAFVYAGAGVVFGSSIVAAIIYLTYKYVSGVI